MAFYSIGSLNFESLSLSERFQPFLFDTKEGFMKTELRITRVAEPHSTQNMVIVHRNKDITVWKATESCKKNDWVLIPNNGVGTFAVSGKYSEIELFYIEALKFIGEKEIREILSSYLQILIECKLAQKGYTVLHAACVELDGKAYAFTGPSGIGKSSRAKKWCELLSAEWISGDRPAIDSSSGMVYGVPWDGKEAIYRNVCFPLAAILNVKRSTEPRIRELSKEEKLQIICDQSFFPMWDKELAIRSLWSIKDLLNRVPIFELYCDITDESIYYAHQLIAEKINQ